MEVETEILPEINLWLENWWIALFCFQAGLIYKGQWRRTIQSQIKAYLLKILFPEVIAYFKIRCSHFLVSYCDVNSSAAALMRSSSHRSMQWNGGQNRDFSGNKLVSCKLMVALLDFSVGLIQQSQWRRCQLKKNHCLLDQRSGQAQTKAESGTQSGLMHRQTFNTPFLQDSHNRHLCPQFLSQ